MPVVILGLIFQNKVEASFQSVMVPAICLLVTGLLLLLTENFSKAKESLNSLNYPKALTIGFFQAISLLPGISRSGATISGGLIFDLKREEAARFSFLLSIPALLGANILTFSSLSTGSFSLFNFLLAVGVAFLVGILTIHYFLRLLARTKLIWFAIYTWVFGLYALYRILL